MIDKEGLYEGLIKNLSESYISGYEGKLTPLAKLVLPTSIVDSLKFDLKFVSNIGSGSIKFFIEEEFNNSLIKYDIELEISQKYDTFNALRIIVTDETEPGTEYVYVVFGRSLDSYGYGFIKRNKNGLLLLYSNINMKENRSTVKLRAFDSETTRFIGEAYLSPKKILESEKYGVKPEISETNEVPNFYSKDAYELFHQKADEILSDPMTLNKKW